MRALLSTSMGAVLLLVLGVTGCAAHGQVTTGTPPPPAIAGPAAGSTPLTFGTGTTLVYDCDQLIDRTTLASLDPKLTADAGYTPAAGTSAAEAVAIKGTACSWSDAPSATVLVVTVAKPDAGTLATLKTQAGAPTTRFGSSVSAYTKGNRLQLVTRDGYWATADSPLLADPAKLAAIGHALLDGLPAG